jgi:GntR family transcriptional regulator
MTARAATGALSRSSPVPLHEQLARIIRSRIGNGEWGAGQRIPSENEFAQQFGISRMTARQVLVRLSDEGLVHRVQGKGTYVAGDDTPLEEADDNGIRAQLERCHRDATIEDFVITRVAPEPDVARALHIESPTTVHRMSWVRRSSTVVVSAHTAFVPTDLVSEISLDMTPLRLRSVLVREHGRSVTTMAETLKAVVSTAALSTVLDVDDGAPLLRVEQTVASREMSPIEFSRAHFRGNLVQLGAAIEL